MKKTTGIALLFAALACYAGDTIIHNYPNTIAGCAQQAPFIFAELGTWGPLSPYKCPAYHDQYDSGVSIYNDTWGCVYGGFNDELPGKPMLEEQKELPISIGCYRIRDYYPLSQIDYDVTLCQPVVPSAHWIVFEYHVTVNN